MRSDPAEATIAVDSERSGAAPVSLLRWLLPLSVALAAGLLYWHTLAPGTVYLQDVAEFQTKLHTLDVIHATGYPFYQMVGKLWTVLLPFGSVAWRVNLLSAFFSVVSLVTLCCILQQIDVRPWAILGACGLLACSRLFWTYSILASTYTMHAALVSLAMWSLLRWQAGRGSGVWFALACGVGLAHHRVFVILLPAFAVAILFDSHARSRLRSEWLKLGVLLIMPMLLSYAWLAALGVWPLGQLLHYLFVEGATYVGHVGDVASWARRLANRILPWLLEFSGPVPTLTGIAGWFVSLRTGADSPRRRTGLLLLLVGACTLGFFSVAWIAPDNRRYLLQLDLVLALGWGLALDELWGMLRRRLRGDWLPKAAQAALAVTACIPLIWLYPKSFEATGRYRDGYADRVSRSILATVESEATIFGGWVLGWPLRYYNTVEKARPDVRMIVEPGGGHHRDQAIDLIEAGKPVYFREAMYRLDQETSGYAWAPMAVGNLARALPALPPLRQTEELATSVIEDRLALQSFSLSSWPLRPDTFVRLQLTWDEIDHVAPETRLSLDLRDAAGVTWWDHEASWSELAGEDSRTNVYWVTPPTLSPGHYALYVEPCPARSPDRERLGGAPIASVPVAAGSPLSAGRLVLENQIHPREPIPLQHPDLRLLGYSFVQREISAGHHQVPVSLYWEVARVPNVSYQASFAVEGREGQIPVSTSCPIAAPYPGALVRTPCVLQVPNGVATGRHRLIAVVSDGQGRWRIPLQHVRMSDRRRVYRVPRMEHALSVSLGDAITLLGYDLSSQRARPGQDLTLTLYWRAEADGEEWLKVFTHLVGAQGTLLAQHDGVPGSGAAPTSEWVSGEVIVDRHTLSLPAHAPVGQYRFYVGIYSPDTGERLVAQDADGEPYPNGAVPLDAITVETE
jgi:4-amino-4-deoxy-L-arabinose transferase-like glycosyltransferase